MLLSKEHLIRECRAKIKDLQILGGKVQVEQGSMDALQASLREAKVDSTRKTALLKKWKERALDLEKKVQEGEIKCRDSHISSKTHAQVSSALRASREKIEGLEGKVKSLRERDAQFCRVIGRFLTDSIALQEAPVGSIADSLLPSSSAAAADGGGDAFKGIDIGQVDLLAQKFSKEVCVCVCVSFLTRLYLVAVASGMERNQHELSPICHGNTRDGSKIAEIASVALFIADSL